MDNIILVSIAKEELEQIIKNAVQAGLENKQQKQLLNTKELIAWLGISMSAVNSWKRTNKIPYKRLGKRIWFSRSEVMHALKDSNYSKFRNLQ